MPSRLQAPWFSPGRPRVRRPSGQATLPAPRYIVTLGSSAPQKQPSVSVNQVSGGGGVGFISFGPSARIITNGVVPGDLVTLSGTSSNDGTYVVSYVLTERVCSVDTNLITETPGGATGVIDTGKHTLEISDEPIITWERILQAVNRRTIVDKIVARSESGSYVVFHHCIDKVKVTHTANMQSEWKSLEEVVVCRQNALGTAWTLELLSTDPGYLRLTLGEQSDPLDRRSYRRGSYWLSVIPPQDLAGGNANKYLLELYDSVLAGGSSLTQLLSTGRDSRFFGSTIEGNLRVVDPDVSGTVEVQDLTIVSRGTGFSIAGMSTINGDRLLEASSALATTAQQQGKTVLRHYDLGASAFTPKFTISTLRDLDLRDLLVDRNPTVLFSVTDGTARKSYTWRPRAVTVDNPEGSSGSTRPVSGVRVDVEMIEVERMAHFLSATSDPPPAATYSVTINGNMYSFVSNGTQSKVVVCQNIATAVNGGSDPVVASQKWTDDGNEQPGVHVIPSDPDKAFTMMTASPMVMRASSLVVDGSPFTSDSAGNVGPPEGIMLEVFFLRNTSGGVDGGGFRRRLRARFSHGDFYPLLKEQKITQELSEDVCLTAWSPNRVNPR